MSNAYRLLCLLFISIALPDKAVAQNVVVKHFTVDDGLPNNTIYSIAQDDQGFLWIATDAGVSQFDGRKFTNFSVADGIPDNEVVKVFKDSRNRIWQIGLTGSLSYYCNGKFVNRHNDSTVRIMPAVSDYLLHEDHQGRIWYASEGHFNILNGQILTTISLNGLCGSGIFANGYSGNIYFISYGNCADHFIVTIKPNGDELHSRCRFYPEFRCAFTSLPDSSLLFYAKEGLVRERDTSQELIMPRDPAGVYSQMIYSRKGKLWITSLGEGVFSIDYRYPVRPAVQYLKGLHATCIMEDNEGNIWVGTLGAGLYMLQVADNTKRNYSPTPEPDGPIRSVTKDKWGNIYAGMNNGQVLVVAGDGSVSKLKTNLGNAVYNPVMSIVAVNDDILFGSDYGVTSYSIHRHSYCPLDLFDRKYRKNIRVAVKNICPYKRGVALCTSMDIFQDTTLCRSKCGATRATNIDTVRKRRYTVFASRDDVLWFSELDGLFALENGTIVPHREVSQGESAPVKSIAETDDSTLVMATYGEGVLFYHRGVVKKRITEKEGLASNICNKVFVTGHDVYVATICGITAFKYDKGNISNVRQLNTSNGLLSNEVNDVYADSSEICIATNGGLTILDATASAISVPAPHLFITAVRCNNRALRPDSVYELSYLQNSLHIEYIGVAYKAASDVRYQYRLNTGEWIDTRNTSAEISYLSPGQYTFWLRAKLLNGNWGIPKLFSFTILPPFWKTNTFVASSLLLLTVVIILAARFVIRKSHNKRLDELRIKDQIMHLEQQALQAMMNPHFVFNVMNSIQHFINTSDAHEANLYLADFARLIRMNLDISSKRYIPLHDEIEYLKLYLSLERLRFEDRLTYDIRIDPAIEPDETLVPVMLLQPFIENALWHGILPMTAKGHVSLSITKAENNLLKVEITDNGVGMPAAEATHKKLKAHESKGMKMTQQRLDLLGKLSGHLLYVRITDAFPDAPNKGTKVELVIPSDLT